MSEGAAARASSKVAFTESDSPPKLRTQSSGGSATTATSSGSSQGESRAGVERSPLAQSHSFGREATAAQLSNYVLNQHSTRSSAGRGSTTPGSRTSSSIVNKIKRHVENLEHAAASPLLRHLSSAKVGEQSQTHGHHWHLPHWHHAHHAHQADCASPAVIRQSRGAPPVRPDGTCIAATS